MNRKKIVEKIRENIRKIEPGATIILFGSEARGDAKVSSNIDILIILDKEKISWEEKENITDFLYKLELESSVLISPLFYTLNEWKNRPFLTPFYVNVVNEGITL